MEAYAALDLAIERDGEDDFMFKICDHIASGESLESVGRIVGVRSTVLKKWIRGKESRIEDYELAKQCFADGLVWSGLEAARDATVENVQVAKLQVDTYHKMAGRLSRDEWGEKVQMEVKQTHSVDIKNLLELREAKLMALDDKVVGVALPTGAVETQLVEL